MKILSKFPLPIIKKDEGLQYHYGDHKLVSRPYSANEKLFEFGCDCCGQYIITSYDLPKAGTPWKEVSEVDGRHAMRAKRFFEECFPEKCVLPIPKQPSFITFTYNQIKKEKVEQFALFMRNAYGV